MLFISKFKEIRHGEPYIPFKFYLPGKQTDAADVALLLDCRRNKWETVNIPFLILRDKQTDVENVLSRRKIVPTPLEKR